MSDKLKFSDITQFPQGKHRETVSFHHIPGWINRHQIEADEGHYILDLSPAYQRDLVWTLSQKQQYLEYLLRGGRSGIDIWWNCPGYVDSYPPADELAVMELVDGKQRVETICSFLKNEFPIFKKYYARDFEHQRFPVLFTFHVLELSPSEVVDFYIKFNSGGTAHSTADMEKAYRCLHEIQSKTPSSKIDLSFTDRRDKKKATENAQIYREIIELAKHI